MLSAGIRALLKENQHGERTVNVRVVRSRYLVITFETEIEYVWN